MNFGCFNIENLYPEPMSGGVVIPPLDESGWGEVRELLDFLQEVEQLRQSWFVPLARSCVVVWNQFSKADTAAVLQPHITSVRQADHPAFYIVRPPNAWWWYREGTDLFVVDELGKLRAAQTIDFRVPEVRLVIWAA